MERIVYVGLGSNLGNSRDLIGRAWTRLEALAVGPVTRSSLWRTSPVDCPPGSPEFLNAVAALQPPADTTPRAFLAQLKTLETEFGRPPESVRNAPRPLDLDLIAWGNAVIRETGLIVPHPRAHLRRFVLAPLAELAPDLVLPGQVDSVMDLLIRCESDEVVERAK